MMTMRTRCGLACSVNVLDRATRVAAGVTNFSHHRPSSKRALPHATFQTHSDLKCAAANRPLADVELASHLFVMLDLVVSFVQVVVENQVALAGRQTVKTVSQTVVLFAELEFRLDAAFDHPGGDFFSPVVFANDISGNAMKITGRLTRVICFDVRQATHHAVDRFIRKIFGVAEALRNKYPHQTRVDGFVLSAGRVSVGA